MNYQCPKCSKRVGVGDTSCPGCGVNFVQLGLKPTLTATKSGVLEPVSNGSGWSKFFGRLVVGLIAWVFIFVVVVAAGFFGGRMEHGMGIWLVLGVIILAWAVESLGSSDEDNVIGRND